MRTFGTTRNKYEIFEENWCSFVDTILCVTPWFFILKIMMLLQALQKIAEWSGKKSLRF